MNRCWLTNYTYEDYVKDKQKKHNIKGIKEYTPKDILMCREERVCEQEELIKFHKKTLVFMRVNYPGVVKNNAITLGIMKFMNKFLMEELKQYIEYKNFVITAEGPSLTLIVNKNAKDTKQITVNIENKHFLGRYVDIDVYDENNNSLSRGMLGFKPRACYICSDIAQYCVRSRKHSEEEIKEFIKNKYEDYCKWYKVL